MPKDASTLETVLNVRGTSGVAAGQDSITGGPASAVRVALIGNPNTG